MPVPSSIDDLDATPVNNSPAGTESAKGVVDDYLRAAFAFIKQNSEFAAALLGTDSGDKAAARATLGAPGVNDVIGQSQAWTDVKASRVVNTNYTNSTGKPIQVSVAILSSSNFSLLAYVDGVLVGSAGNVAGFASNLSFIVPPSAAYQIQVSAGVPTVSVWTELR